MTVAPSVNLSVALASTSPSVVAGKPLTLTATVQNSGPSPATNVTLRLPMAAGVVFDGSSASAGNAGMVGGAFVVQLGVMDPGSSVTISLVVTPQTPGTLTQTAGVTAAENELDPASANATATVTVLESPGTLAFSSALFSVAENANLAVVTVVRTGGTLGAVTVGYQTAAINATPGLDFVPTAGTLTFASGQAVGAFLVPVIADPWDNHDEYVSLQLFAPGGGASLGSVGTAQLKIVDIDPDNTPPQVSQLTWSGNSTAITSLTMSFDSPLDPTFAVDAADYRISIPSKGGMAISVSSVTYSSASHSVTLVPSSPLPSGQFYEIQVAGTGATAIRDLAGNVLDGNSSGLPGSNYTAYFGQGTRLHYVDNTGNKVSLKLNGPGYLMDVLDAQSVGQTLTVMGAASHRTRLSGTIRKTRRSSGSTNLGTIQGLGNFGDVRVSLRSPPFLVKLYPFSQRGRGVL